MYKKFISALYSLNIIAQCIFTLLTPTALTLLISWLLVKYASVPTWIYAILVPLGVISGLISMVKFAISASEGLERLERERDKKQKKQDR